MEWSDVLSGDTFGSAPRWDDAQAHANAPFNTSTTRS